jgi:putative transposase
MPKKAHSEEQIVTVLRQGETGEKVADICRKVGISEGTYYAWKKRYAGLGINELRELRQLREENGRLKRLVADLSLDRQILQEIVSKKLSKARPATEAGAVGPANVSDRAAASG